MSESNREVEQEVRERRLKVLETCLGPSIMHYMHDDNVTEVMVNPDGRVWLDTFDKGFQKTEVIMKVENTKRIIYSIADMSGQVAISKQIRPYRRISRNPASLQTVDFRRSCRRSSLRRASISANTPRSSLHSKTMCGKGQ